MQYYHFIGSNLHRRPAASLRRECVCWEDEAWRVCLCVCLQSLVMDFNLLTDSEARSPALSLSDSGTPQHDQGCKGQDNSGQ